MSALNVIDSIRDHYNTSYKFFLSIIEDMRNYDWPKESCLNIMTDMIRSHMKLNGEYVDQCKSDIKSSIDKKVVT